MNEFFDTIIIGSGMGGLSSASLLAKHGKKVLVLEKGTSPGGCSSSFQKAGYIFESGATTLVGWEEGLPMQSLERQLGEKFPKWELALSMMVYMDGKKIQRFGDKDAWIQESIRHFQNPIRQTVFWRFIFFFADSVWSISRRYRYFPFNSILDVVRSLPSFRPKDALAFFFSFISVGAVLRILGLGGDKKFINFLNEQLMITNQCKANEAPFLLASAGLSYPNLVNYYAPGGMIEIPKTLLSFIQKHGGSYKNKSEVMSVRKVSDGTAEKVWEVKTKHDTFYCFDLISNIPIWNLESLFTSKEPSIEGISKMYEKGIWGAFTMGIAMEADLAGEECLHHQIHLSEPIPFGGGDSIFVSISHKDDLVRSKDGIRILSISTHLSDPETWNRKDPDYQIKKRQIEAIVIAALSDTFPWFQKNKIAFQHSATPVTWQTWTGRKFGRVGGIPSSYFSNPFRYLSSLSGIPNFYLTGDTVYPGQGIPAVCIGGINLANRLIRTKRD